MPKFATRLIVSPKRDCLSPWKDRLAQLATGRRATGIILENGEIFEADGKSCYLPEPFDAQGSSALGSGDASHLRGHGRVAIEFLVLTAARTALVTRNAEIGNVCYFGAIDDNDSAGWLRSEGRRGCNATQGVHEFLLTVGKVN
jgi:hypothetical protein